MALVFVANIALLYIEFMWQFSMVGRDLIKLTGSLYTLIQIYFLTKNILPFARHWKSEISSGFFH